MHVVEKNVVIGEGKAVHYVCWQSDFEMVVVVKL